MNRVLLTLGHQDAPQPERRPWDLSNPKRHGVVRTKEFPPAAAVAIRVLCYKNWLVEIIDKSDQATVLSIVALSTNLIFDWC